MAGTNISPTESSALSVPERILDGFVAASLALSGDSGTQSDPVEEDILEISAGILRFVHCRGGGLDAMDEPVQTGIAISGLIDKRVDETLEDVALLRLVERIGIVRPLVIVSFHIVDVAGNPPVQQVRCTGGPAHHAVGNT